MNSFKVYVVVGGVLRPWDEHGSTEIYNTDTGSWKKIDPFPISTTNGLKAVRLDNTILTLGKTPCHKCHF